MMAGLGAGAAWVTDRECWQMRSSNKETGLEKVLSMSWRKADCTQEKDLGMLSWQKRKNLISHHQPVALCWSGDESESVNH